MLVEGHKCISLDHNCQVLPSLNKGVTSLHFTSLVQHVTLHFAWVRHRNRAEIIVLVGWFSNVTGTSFNDWKARGKD